MHVVVHVGELGWVRERVDATRDKPYRQATAARGAREPDRDAVLSSERVERGAHIIIGAKSIRSAVAVCDLRVGRTAGDVLSIHRTLTSKPWVRPYQVPWPSGKI